MEYVEGVPLTEYALTRSLPTRDRLRLFITVCEAVDYAHRNLIAHRDIKPANILVTPDGVPKLLDFGIAKLVSTEPTTGQQQTRLAERFMTPEFASPEQIRGDAVTTSTDIYSLGVLLYVLLTARRPYETDNLSASQLEKVICDQEPERPSVAVLRAGAHEHARQLNRELAGDLDQIVAMAMRKEPSARYGSVGLLIEDLKRYLDGYPVAARKGAWTYNIAKFARRHRLGVAMAALFAVTVVAFAAGMTVLANRIRIQRDAAQREARAEQQVSNFLVNLFSAANTDKSGGRPLTARDLLDNGVTAVDHDLEGQPELQARLMDTMGKAYYSLGVYPQSEATIRKSLEIRQASGGAETEAVAESLKDIAETLRLRSKFPEAEAAARQSLAIRKKLRGPQDVAVAESLNTLGMIVWQKGDPASADPLFRDALTIRTKLEGPESTGVAVYMSNLGGVLRAENNLADAEALYRKVWEIRKVKLGPEHPRTAISMNGLALVLESTGSL